MHLTDRTGTTAKLLTKSAQTVVTVGCAVALPGTKKEEVLYSIILDPSESLCGWGHSPRGSGEERFYPTICE
jgi:hypothetical protein